MGLDAMLTAPDFKTVQVAPNRFRNEWGIVVEKGEEQHSTVVQAVIQTLEDFGKYQAPDAFAPDRFDSLKKLVARARRHRVGVWLYLNEPRALPPHTRPVRRNRVRASTRRFAQRSNRRKTCRRNPSRSRPA